jgi:hypothetical protein
MFFQIQDCRQKPSGHHSTRLKSVHHLHAQPTHTPIRSHHPHSPARAHPRRPLSPTWPILDQTAIETVQRHAGQPASPRKHGTPPKKRCVAHAVSASVTCLPAPWQHQSRSPILLSALALVAHKVLAPILEVRARRARRAHAAQILRKESQLPVQRAVPS